jgi:hypothetical protein
MPLEKPISNHLPDDRPAPLLKGLDHAGLYWVMSSHDDEFKLYEIAPGYRWDEFRGYWWGIERWPKNGPWREFTADRTYVFKEVTQPPACEGPLKEGR